MPNEHPPVINKVNEVLFRSSRPGYPGNACIPAAVVQTWIDAAKRQGIRTIICLLDSQQLDSCHGDLLEAVRGAGFSVMLRPVAGHAGPPVPDSVLTQLAYDFAISEKPVLVHCIAGTDRTGAAVGHLQSHGAPPEIDTFTEIMRTHCDGRGEPHFTHVTRLALRIFDQLPTALRDRVPFEPRHRVLLWAAGMLHDIGNHREFSHLAQEHASASARAILKAHLSIPSLGVTATDLATVACLHSIAQYDEHTANALWNNDIPAHLKALGAILRVADGCDRNLAQAIADVSVSATEIFLHPEERAAEGGIQTCSHRAQKKSVWLTEIFGLAVRCADAQPPQAVP